MKKSETGTNVDISAVPNSDRARPLWTAFVERIHQFTHECRVWALAETHKVYRRLPRLERWHLMAVAAEKGGWYIAAAEELSGHVAKKPHLWQCASGHQFLARYDNVKSGHWCPRCRAERWTYARLLTFLLGRPFVCISPAADLVNNKSVMRFMCLAKGHVWATTLTNITSRKSGCPCCLFKGEQYVREVFQDLFGEPFMPAYPKWLRLKSGAQLQIDCYSSELCIAVEYQGQQHFYEVKVWKHGKRQLRELQQRDAEKRRILKLRGITLVEIPYFPKDCFTEQAFKEHVIQHIPKNVLAWAGRTTALKSFRVAMTAVRPSIFDNVRSA